MDRIFFAPKTLHNISTAPNGYAGDAAGDREGECAGASAEGPDGPHRRNENSDGAASRDLYTPDNGRRATGNTPVRPMQCRFCGEVAVSYAVKNTFPPKYIRHLCVRCCRPTVDAPHDVAVATLVAERERLSARREQLKREEWEIRVCECDVLCELRLRRSTL